MTVVNLRACIWSGSVTIIRALHYFADGQYFEKLMRYQKSGPTIRKRELDFLENWVRNNENIIKRSANLRSFSTNFSKIWAYTDKGMETFIYRRQIIKIVSKVIPSDSMIFCLEIDVIFIPLTNPNFWQVICKLTFADYCLALYWHFSQFVVWIDTNVPSIEFWYRNISASLLSINILLQHIL